MMIPFFFILLNPFKFHEIDINENLGISFKIYHTLLFLGFIYDSFIYETSNLNKVVFMGLYRCILIKKMVYRIFKMKYFSVKRKIYYDI